MTQGDGLDSYSLVTAPERLVGKFGQLSVHFVARDHRFRAGILVVFSIGAVTDQVKPSQRKRRTFAVVDLRRGNRALRVEQGTDVRRARSRP